MGIVPKQPARLDHSGQLSAHPTPAFRPQIVEPAPAIPDYELLRRVGRGAYGEVWLARNLTGSFVAVKVVARAAFEYDRPFEREFEGIKRFEPISRSDPAQVAVLHVGRGDGFFYYVMELADDANAECGARSAELEGTPHSAVGTPESYVPHTLREDLKRQGRLPILQCIQIGLALARALAHLHKSGLVHRDVKPSNVIFVGGVPKLADIGLVASVDATRSLVGTEGYVAPEGPGTPQADLYSLGKLLYEISTGCDRKEFPALPPDIASRSDRDALVELNAIVMRACQFDPHQRHGNAEAMLAELELMQRGQSVQRKRRLRQCWVGFKRAGIGLACLAALAATIAALVRGVTPSNLYPDGPPSTSDDANILCQQGMDILRSDRYEDFPAAYTKLNRAIELDPHFAKPYVGLLELLLRESNPDVKGNQVDIRQVASRLRELAPNLAATYCASSIISFYDWDFPSAKRDALRATEANRGYELGHTWYGYVLLLWGWPREGRAEAKVSADLRPAKSVVYRCRGHTYYAERDFTNAIKWYRQTLDVEPHHAAAFSYMGSAFRALGDYTNALANFEAHDLLTEHDKSEVRQRYQGLRRAYEERGARGYWEQEWKLSEQRPDQGLYEKAIIQMHLGDTNAALDWLEKSFVTRERYGLQTELTDLLFDECWDGMHNHPRFKALLEKIGFTKVMPSRMQ